MFKRHLNVAAHHRRRLRGNWGDGPSKIWGGGQPMHPPPQYFEK